MTDKPDKDKLTLERTNKMMAMPEMIITSDGRELKILQWEPAFSVSEGTIRVMMLAVVLYPGGV